MSSRTRTLFLFIVVLSALSLVLMILSPRLAEHLLFFPTRGSLGAPPPLAGTRGEDVALTTSDGVGIHGWWYEVDEGAPVVLFFHGNAGDISGRTPIALGLIEEGFSVLLLEYRGYGGSDGSPTEEGLYEDGRAGYDFALSRAGSPDRVVIHGRSMGGAVAARIAAEKEVGALILESAFTSLVDVGKAVYPLIPSFLLTRLRGLYATQDAVRKVEAPVLIVHGTEDEIVPVRLGLALLESASEPKEWYGIEGAGHNDTFYMGGEEYFQRIGTFVRMAIGETES
ncbi:alpha/beta hydrolase [Gemmatimonadota bacterium]